MIPRIRLCVLFFACQVMLLLATTAANAHSAYITNSLKVNSATHGVLDLQFLHGDDVFFADPVQVIITDSQKHLLAASEVSGPFYVECPTLNPDVEDCLIFDSFSGSVLVPSMEKFEVKGPIFKQDQWAYPNDEWQFGFTVRPVGFVELLGFEVRNILRFPIIHLKALVWYALWALAFISLFRFKNAKLTGWFILKKMAQGAVALLMTLITFFVGAVHHISQTNFVALIIGGVAVFFVVSYLVKLVRPLLRLPSLRRSM